MRPGHASSTALLIARSTLVSSANPAWRKLVDPRAARLCAAFLRDHQAFGSARVWLYRRAGYRRALGFLERLTLPGVQLHYALRKKRIEEEVRAGLGEGFANVCLVGAGFDTLAWRLAKDFPQVRCLEVDHPDTQKAKILSLERVGDVPPNLSFQTLDLEAPAGIGPGATGASAAATDTIVVAEGVLMYLTEANVRRFFIDLRRRFTGNLRVVFTFMVLDPLGRIRFHDSSPLVGLWLRLKGEPFAWGLKSSDVEEFLADLGFGLVGLAGHEELRARFLAEWPGEGARIARGEWLAVAEAGP